MTIPASRWRSVWWLDSGNRKISLVLRKRFGRREELQLGMGSDIHTLRVEVR